MGFKKWWYLRVRNPRVREGEKGGFKWCFRRYTLDVSTVSGNWSGRWTASENPYAYLLAGKTDDNIVGYCQIMYQVGMLLTTEQRFATDIQNALKRYNNRIAASVKLEEDSAEEAAAIASERAVQEHIELPKKERKKVEKEIDRKFKKAMKNG